MKRSEFIAALLGGTGIAAAKKSLPELHKPERLMASATSDVKVRVTNIAPSGYLPVSINGVSRRVPYFE